MQTVHELTPNQRQRLREISWDALVEQARHNVETGRISLAVDQRGRPARLPRGDARHRQPGGGTVDSARRIDGSGDRHRERIMRRPLTAYGLVNEIDQLVPRVFGSPIGTTDVVVEVIQAEVEFVRLHLTEAVLREGRVVLLAVPVETTQRTPETDLLEDR